MKLIAVTACPTGIAHTYMAAEQLEKAAKSLGHKIKVETQGAMGIENELTPADIKDADFVIFAVDIAVEQEEPASRAGRSSVCRFRKRSRTRRDLRQVEVGRV